MQILWKALSAVLILFSIYVFWQWDSSAPAVKWVEAPSTVGRETRIVIEAEDPQRGLASIEVAVDTKGTRRVLLEETYTRSWPWEEGFKSRSIALSPQTSFEPGDLKEGEFWLEVTARDHSNLWFWDRQTTERRAFQLDLTPPAIQVLSTQHYIRQGGSEAILYSVSEDTVASGVQVGDHVFHGYPLPQRGPQTHISLFALPHHESPEVSMLMWAEDAAGNRSQVSFWKKTFPVRFRKRVIQLSDSLINQVVPEIVSKTSEINAGETPLETFLAVNGELRRRNHETIRELSRRSAPELLWSESFLQLSNSQVESAFADYRSYVYGGKKVDEQTHLGFDLASVVHSPVECANDGIVALAEYFGIYGNTIIVDHGLGLFSLYGHLSSIEVQEGQPVKRGQILGRTGQTGLAAGDHLHFSLILQGVQTNPIEWWDPNWVKVHVLDKVQAN